MVFGALLCTDCGIVIETVNPNGGARICLDCGNSHLNKADNCGECKSNNTREILYLSAQPVEVCPTCKVGLLRFCI